MEFEGLCLSQYRYRVFEAIQSSACSEALHPFCHCAILVRDNYGIGPNDFVVSLGVLADFEFKYFEARKCKQTMSSKASVIVSGEWRS